MHTLCIYTLPMHYSRGLFSKNATDTTSPFHSGSRWNSEWSSFYHQGRLNVHNKTIHKGSHRFREAQCTRWKSIMINSVAQLCARLRLSSDCKCVCVCLYAGRRLRKCRILCVYGSTVIRQREAEKECLKYHKASSNNGKSNYLGVLIWRRWATFDKHSHKHMLKQDSHRCSKKDYL